MRKLSRRKFIAMAAMSTAAAAVYSGCTPFPTRNEFLTQSPAAIPEDSVSGTDNWYATVCRACGAGCGTIVRVYMGRALKVEGNPDYPVNQGKLCARGQTAVQALYHPDRFHGPLRRVGDRGSGRYESISWDDALNDLLSRLRDVSAPNNRGSLLAITGPQAGHRQLVIDRFVSGLGGRQVVFEPLPRAVLAAAARGVFGQDQWPHFDIARSQYILSFGADFLGTWLSPVQYNRAYGEFRQPQNRGRANRGYFVQVEPRLSQTASNADEWLPIRPGAEGILALSIAQVILSQGLAAQLAAAALGAGGAAALQAFSPDRASETTGIPAEKIAQVARDFASQRPALAIGGDQAAAHSNGLFNLIAIYTLNFLVDSVGKPGGILFNPPGPFSDLKPAPIGASFADWQQLAQRLQSGQPPVNVLLVHDANPVYGLPQSMGIAEALKKVPYIVSFSSFPDETTDLADLILPDHAALETWGDELANPAPGLPVVGFQQPLVKPLYDTRDSADVLLALTGQLGGEVQRALPWANYLEVLKAAAAQLQRAGAGSVTGSNADQFWNDLLQKGGWWNAQAQAVAPPATLTLPALPAQLPPAQFAGADYPFNLIVYPQLALGDGQCSHLPWMQSMPDPLTTVAWYTWVEINPDTAKQLGVGLGDIVAVESPNGTVEAPVYPYPGIGRDSVAMPLGQGHQSYGQWAKDRGVNPLSILAPITESQTGSLAWAATKVRIRATGKQTKLPIYEYAVPTLEEEAGTIVKVVRE